VRRIQDAIVFHRLPGQGSLPPLPLVHKLVEEVRQAPSRKALDVGAAPSREALVVQFDIQTVNQAVAIRICRRVKNPPSRRSWYIGHHEDIAHGAMIAHVKTDGRQFASGADPAHSASVAAHRSVVVRS
jgi:hypothetical protein